MVRVCEGVKFAFPFHQDEHLHVRLNTNDTRFRSETRDNTRHAEQAIILSSISIYFQSTSASVNP
jgi:hypothetical protein